MPVRPGRQGRPRTAFVLGQTRPKGPKGLPWFGSVRLLLLRSKRRVAPLPHPSLRAGRRQVRLKPLRPRGALGVGCWNTETSATRCAARLLSAVAASRMVTFTSLNRALRSSAVDFGASGPRALGGAGSPPNLAPGRWVLGVGCLDVNISTTASPIWIPRLDLTSLGPRLPSLKRACGSGVVGFWALGALWALGVGRWVARALGVQTQISRRRGVRSRFRGPPWHRPGP